MRGRPATRAQDGRIDVMSCENVQDRISSLLDRRLPVEEREIVLAHLETCRECGVQFETLQTLRAALRKLDGPAVPAQLSARLRDIAAQERVRQITRNTNSPWTQRWMARIGLTFENIMRPLALPFAGGMLSALLLFGILVPTLSFQHSVGDKAFFTDPYGMLVVNPYGLTAITTGDNPKLEPADTATVDYANVVELTIDQDGRVTGYSLLRGNLTPDLQSIIMLSRFNPATYMGLPTKGKVQVVQGPSGRRS